MAFTEDEKKILEKYVTSTEDNVFAVRNLPGMVGAAYARYSRAKGGFREVLLKEFIQEGNVDPKHADELIARVLVAYGDDSVGELEGAHVSFEKITMLAAKEIEDHRIGGSPIEQSTRYVLYDQKDAQGNWLYYKDETILNSEFSKQYIETMDFIFQTYADLVEPLKNYFVNLKKLEDAEYDINGDGIKEKWADLKDESEQKSFKQTYNFDLRAKACDTLRALLPVGTLTNVGMFANGRFYQTVISNLMTHNLPEMHTIAQQTTAALQPIIPQYIRRAKKDEYAEKFIKEMYSLAKTLFNKEKPEVPSILPEYDLLDYSEEFIVGKLKSKEVSAETLKEAMQEAKDIEEIATMVYPYTNVSLRTIRDKVAEMSDTNRQEIVAVYLQTRENRRHRPGRGLENGYTYNFDCTINFGTYKDLQRHRMNTQQRQLFTTKIGFYMPEELVAAGFEDKVKEALTKSDALFDAMAKVNPEMAQYAVLHGHYIRWNIALNDRALMHLLELRSTPQGHPNYRVAAQQMHKLISARSKWRGDMMKFVDHNDYYWSRADSEAKQRVKERELDKKFGHSSTEENE
ncbi:MAG: FAD-dependent thymidylate synthase [Candidatus Doudnabacteria bacterium]